MRIAVCEDESVFRKKLKREIETLQPKCSFLYGGIIC